MENTTIQNKPQFDRKQYFSQTEVCECFSIKVSQFHMVVKDADIILFDTHIALHSEELKYEVTTHYIRKKDLAKFVNELLKT